MLVPHLHAHFLLEVRDFDDRIHHCSLNRHAFCFCQIVVLCIPLLTELHVRPLPVFDPLPLANDFLPFREVEGLLGPGLFPASKLRTASRGHSPTPDSRSHTTSLNIAAKLLDLASPEEVLQQSFLVAAGEAAAKGIRWSEGTLFM